MLRNTVKRYGCPSQALHWGMAVLILGMLALGLVMDEMPTGPDKLRLVGLHKSFGVLVLVLAMLRLCWRIVQVIPALPEDMPAWQRKAARGAHHLLYLLMMAMPLSGWAMSSAAGYPVAVFDRFTLPPLVPVNPEFKDFFKETHEILAFGLMALIAAHVGAALYHHFIRKDDVLRGMLPSCRPCASSPSQE